MHSPENDAAYTGPALSTATADQRAVCAAGGPECPDCAYVIPPVMGDDS